MKAEMKKAGYLFGLVSGIFGFVMLFLLIFLYIFTALGLLSAGIIVFPSSLLGMAGLLDIITDVGLPVLCILGVGLLLLGGGMCLGTAVICPASINRLHSFMKKMEWRKRRLYNEED